MSVTAPLSFPVPNLTCNTAAGGDDVQFVAVGTANVADLDGDGLDDRTVGTIQQQAGTLMHEFGHNLNLQHGGNNGTNFKPNYLSIMNYSFQMPGIPPTDPDGTGPLSGRLDYSPDDLADLNENALNEPAGIGDGTDNTLFTCPGGGAGAGVGNGAIDWNCDGDRTDASVSVDTNADGAINVLTGFDDWADLKLDFQNTSDFEDGIHLTTVDQVEIDQFTALQIAEVVDLSISKSDTPDPAIAGEALTYEITVLNTGPGDAEDVVVVDTLPAGLTYMSDSAACDTNTLPTLSCALGEIPSGESRIVTVQVLVAADLVYNAGGPTTITNLVSVTSASADLDLANNDDSEQTMVVAVADLEILSFDAVNPPAQILVGAAQDLTLRKVIVNNGPSAPMDVLLKRTAIAPADSTVTPSETSTTETALGLAEERTVDEIFTIQCNGYSNHTFSFTNEMQPANAEDTDPDHANNTAGVNVSLECVVPVKIDIKPNKINLNGNGVVPVVIFATAAGEGGLPLAFNPATIDPITVRFGPRDLVWSNTGGASEVHGTDHSNGNNGQRMYHFRARETGLNPGHTEACMKGTWRDALGNPHTFFGCKQVTVTGAKASVSATSADADETEKSIYVPFVQR